MSRRRIHVAIGTTAIDAARYFYEQLFGRPPDKTGEVELGTGRIVNGAYWKTEYIYFYVFEGCEFGMSNCVDHLGIQFFDDDDMEEVRSRVVTTDDEGRWWKDPSTGITWELFPNVFEEDKAE
jgi:catechol 2,3-dioxygenase-like lactoylglutathione lyase family enzyme